MNNKLTDERVNHYAEHGFICGYNRRDIQMMAVELQQRRQADKNCFMYGIADPDGKPYLDEFCVSSDLGLMEDEVSALNDTFDTDDYRVVALYTALPLTDSERTELQEHRKADLRKEVRVDHAAWADKTFGSIGPVGPLKHLSKEALEAAAAPGDLSEWADMQFLLWDAQRRAGISDEQITQAMVEKLAVNKTRQWPEPKDGEPRLHIKEQPAPIVPDEITSASAPEVFEITAEAERLGLCGTYASYAVGWNACRAAMLQNQYRDLSQPVDPQISEYEKIMLQAGNSPVIPDGYALVPIVPTEDMVINGFESEPDPHFSDEKVWAEYEALSGCRRAARRAELCWAAMIKAAPKPEEITDELA